MDIMKISKATILITWWALLFYVVVLSGSAEAYALCFEVDGHIALKPHQNCCSTCLARIPPFKNSYSLSIVNLSSSKEHCSSCKDFPVGRSTGMLYVYARCVGSLIKSVVHSSFSYNALAFGEIVTQHPPIVHPPTARSPLLSFPTIILLI
jgi:hypothetical protein